MASSVTTLWPEMDDTLSDDEVVARGLSGPALPALPPAEPQLDRRQQLIIPSAAARYLGRSVETTHRWVRERRLPAVKIGRSTMLRVGDVEDFIQASMVSAIDRRVATTKHNELSPALCPNQTGCDPLEHQQVD